MDETTARRLAENALRDSEARLRLALDSADIGTYAWDVASGAIVWDARVRSLWAVDPVEPVDYGMFLAGLHPDDREATQAAVARALDPAGNGRYCVQYRVIGRDDGVTRWVSATGQVFFEDGRPLRFIGAVRDVSERRLAEQALRDSEARNAAFLENSATVAWLKDADGRYVYLSSNCQRRFDSRNWLGKTDHEIWPPDIAERFRQNDIEVLATGRTVEVVEEALESDGSRSWWLSSKFLLTDGRGRRHVGGLAVDITKRMQAEAELEQRVSERTEQVRRLAAELEAAAMRERRQISQDLHDDLGQTLAAMQIRLSKLCRHEREDVRAMASDLADLLTKANRSTHSLAAQLASPVLYELGLVPALESLAEELLGSFGLSVVIESDPPPFGLSDDQRPIVYRAVRELLINVAKHANVATATVRLERRAGALIVTVSDQGCGLGSGPDAGRNGGLGLAGVRERMTRIGGSLDVQSSAAGTEAVLRVPLSGDKPRRRGRA